MHAEQGDLWSQVGALVGPSVPYYKPSPQRGYRGHTTPIAGKEQMESLMGAGFCGSLTALVQGGFAAGPLG